MERDFAVGLMAEILKLSDQLNVIIGKVEELSSESDRSIMRKHMANMMAASDDNLYRPILRFYPDLDPLDK